MMIEHVERYIIEQCTHGVIIRMRQSRQTLGIGFLSFAVLLVSWWFGPYGPQPASDWANSWFYWIWSGFFLLVFILALVGSFYREDWTIVEQGILVTKSIGPWCQYRQVSKAGSFGIRIEDISDSEAIFPYRLHFFVDEQMDFGLLIELQMTESVDRFVNALRTALIVDIEDQRKGLTHQSTRHT